MKTDIYQKLRKNLDHMPVPFPATKSGVELELLKCLFTKEEAQIAGALSAFPESAEKIWSRLKKDGLSLEEIRKKLDEMGEKGLIMANDKRNKKEKNLS